MTNRIALILFILIVALFAFDIVMRDGETSVFLGKKLFEFLDWIAFWR